MGPQMLPRAKKTTAWKENQLDRMAEIAKIRLNENAKLLRNYQMIRGTFITEHYVTEEGVKDMIAQLTQEFEMPDYLRHFDIIASTVNTLSGEWQEHPDNYSIRRIDPNGTNDYMREKKRLIEQYINEQIQFTINRQLIESGIDPSGENIPEEEKEAYMQALEEQKKAMTPPEVEKYMRMSYQDFAEIWAKKRLKRNKELFFNYKTMERIEIEDIFTASRCFRHFFLTPGGHKEETWNPVNVFYVISPDEHRAEKAELIGRKFFCTKSDVLGRYGHRLTKTQLEEIDGVENTGGNWLNSKTDAYGIDYGAVVPFLDYPEHKMFVENMGFNPGVELSDDLFNSLFKSGMAPLRIPGMLEIVEGYFRGKEKIGALTYISPETGMLVTDYVSEDFVLPPFIKETKKPLTDDMEPNTIRWSYQDRIYWGVRIVGNGLKRPIYLGGEPCEFEFSEPNNPFELNMPVCGLLYNFRNADGASIVDLMTSDQIAHNVVMNQGMQLLQRELGRFLVLDPRMIPAMKDWGGERGWEKFTEVAKNLGITFADTSPEKLKGANSGNAFPRMIDMDETQRIMGRFKLAETFEVMAKRRIGMSDQRLGDIGSSETAEGVKQSIRKSYNQTSSYFTDFSEYVKRCKRFSLDMSQFVDSRKGAFKMNMGEGEIEKYFIEINGNDLKFAQFDLYISDNQEDLRRMNLMRGVFMNNPNIATDPIDVFEVINADSPNDIKNQLLKSKATKDAMAEQQQGIQQQQIESAEKMKAEEMAWEREKHYSKLESDEKRAYMQSFSRQEDNMADTSGDAVPDILQFEKLAADKTHKQQVVDVQKERNTLERQKMDNDMKKHSDNVALQKQKAKVQEIKEKIKLQIAKVNPG